MTSHSYDIFVHGQRTYVNSLGKFQVYNTVLLTTATVIYIRSPELIHPIQLNLCIL